MTMPHILLVEDEVALAVGIQDNLVAEGYGVTVMGDDADALAHLMHATVSLIILDVMLPSMDGYSVCAALRARGDRTPILFLSAKNTPSERVHGLSLGGDDYLGKPFHLEELLVRVAALLRRGSWGQHGGVPPEEAGCVVGTTHTDFGRMQLTHADGRIEEIPARELAILKLLCSRRGEVVSRDEILDGVWGHDVYPSSRTVDNFIVRLRRRFEPNPQEPQYLFTVRGVGYRLAPLDD